MKYQSKSINVCLWPIKFIFNSNFAKITKVVQITFSLLFASKVSKSPAQTENFFLFILCCESISKNFARSIFTSFKKWRLSSAKFSERLIWKSSSDFVNILCTLADNERRMRKRESDHWKCSRADDVQPCVDITCIVSRELAVQPFSGFGAVSKVNKSTIEL